MKLITNQKTKNKKTKIGLFVFIFVVLTFSALAEPRPLGIDGYVYDLDNITLASNDVIVSYTNLNNSRYFSGNVRFDGSYSFVIDANKGDLIRINAWNDIANISRMVEIEGVVHDFDLQLELVKSTGDESNELLDMYEYIRKSRKRFSGNNHPPKIPKVFISLITSDGKPARVGTPYEILNENTGESVIGEVQEKFSGISDVINAEIGDDLRVRLGDIEENNVRLIPVTGAVIRDDIDIGEQKTTLFEFYKKNMWLILFVLTTSVLFIFYRFVISKKKIKKKIKQKND